MEIIYIVFIFIIGCIFGSFFNVVGYRVPNELSIVRPGSFCPKCKHSLRWYELIPIFSFLIQKGKCRDCKEKISIIYPVVELTTGILFVSSYLIFGFSNQFLVNFFSVSVGLYHIFFYCGVWKRYSLLFYQVKKKIHSSE